MYTSLEQITQYITSICKCCLRLRLRAAAKLYICLELDAVSFIVSSHIPVCDCVRVYQSNAIQKQHYLIIFVCQNSHCQTTTEQTAQAMCQSALNKTCIYLMDFCVCAQVSVVDIFVGYTDLSSSLSFPAASRFTQYSENSIKFECRLRNSCR